MERDLVGQAHAVFTATTARDWCDFLELIHPECEAELRSQPGRIIRGREEMEAFVRGVIPTRVEHQMVPETIEQIGDDAVVALGRLYMIDDQGTRDSPAGWLMLFEDGLLRRSYLVDSVEHGRSLLASLASVDRSGRSDEDLEEETAEPVA